MQRSMSVVDYRRFNRLRRFMEEVPNAENIVPKDCKSCECYQPNWKYRTCLYARCKYNKPINVFRDKPNPGAKSQGMKQLMAGGGVALIGTTLVPLLAGLF